MSAKGDSSYHWRPKMKSLDHTDTQCRHNREVLRCKFCNPQLKVQGSAKIIVEHKFIPSSCERITELPMRTYNGRSRSFIHASDTENERQREENDHLKYMHGKTLQQNRVLLQEKSAANSEVRKLEKELDTAKQCVTAAQFIIKQLQHEKAEDVATISLSQAENKKLVAFLKQAEEINHTKNQQHLQEMKSVTEQNCHLKKELEDKERRSEDVIEQLNNVVANKDEWIEELGNKIKLQDCEVDVVRHVNDEYTVKIKDLQEQINCMQTEANQQKEKLEQMGVWKNKYDHVNIENEELVNKLSISKCSEKEWRNKVDHLDVANQQLKRSIDTYKQTIVELNEENEHDKTRFQKDINNYNIKFDLEREMFKSKFNKLERKLKDKMALIDHTEIAHKNLLDDLQKQSEDEQKQHDIERTKLANKIKELELQLKENIALTENAEVVHKTLLNGLQKQSEDEQKQHNIERTQLADKIKQLGLQLKDKMALTNETEIAHKFLLDSLQKQLEEERTKLADKIKELELQFKENIASTNDAEIKHKTLLDGLQKQLQDEQKQHDIERTKLADKIKELELQLKEKIVLQDDQKQNGIERTKFKKKIKELELQLKDKMALTDDAEIAHKYLLDNLQKQLEDEQKRNGIKRTELADKIKELEFKIKENGRESYNEKM